MNIFLSISMAYNVISCQKVAENTQIRYVNLAPDLRNRQKKAQKNITQSGFTIIFE